MERLRNRKKGHLNSMKNIMEFYDERIKIEEEYSQKLNDLGTKYINIIENANEFEDFPPTFVAVTNDTQQLGVTRKQLKDQLSSEILTPVQAFVDENPHPEKSLSDSMNFTSASLDLRDFIGETQEIIRESLSKYNIIFSILSEFEQDFTKRFTAEIEQFDISEFIYEIISREESYFPKSQPQTSSKPKEKKKKNFRVTFAPEIATVIGFSDTESKLAPLFVGETQAEEEAFAEIAAIMGRKPAPREHEQPKKLYEDIDDDDPRFKTPTKTKSTSAAVDPLDSFLMATKKRDDSDEDSEPEPVPVKPPKPVEEPPKMIPVPLVEETKPQPPKPVETEKPKEKPAKPAKPAIPAKPSLPPKPTEYTSLGIVMVENVSCQFIKGQLMRCDLSGQVSFVGTLRKDTTDFYFDLNDKSNIENIVPNKSFVHMTPQQKLGYQCSVQALSNYISPANPVAGLKYRVLSNTIADRVPLMVSIAWKCEPSLTSVIVTYKGSSTFPLTLNDVSIEVPISGGATGVQSKPQAQYTQSTQSVKWDLGTLKVGPGTDVQGKLLARVSVQKQSTPAPASAYFACEGQLLSDCAIEIQGPDTIKWQPVVKRLVSLTYMGS